MTTKANVYEMVTARIIAELEKGNIPWKRPWTGVRSGNYKETLQHYQSDSSETFWRICNIQAVVRLRWTY